MIVESSVQRWSLRLSYWLHPAVLLFGSMWLASFLQRQHAGYALLDALILIAGLLPGLGYIAWLVRRGAVSHPHLLFKEERRIVLPLLLLGLVAVLGVYQLIDAPRALRDGMLIGIIEGSIVIIITRFWKISLHAMTGMTCAALFVPIQGWIALGIVVLALITGLARLPVRHHTLAQVVAGWLYGFGMTVVLLWLLTEQL